MADEATLTAQAEALEKSEIKECFLPYSTFSQETADLYNTASSDAAQLTEKGLPQEVIDNLSVWAMILQKAQANVKGAISHNKEDQAQWNEQYKEGVKLRDDILKNEEFAFFKFPLLLDLLEQVKEGDDYADTIEDMHVLAKIGRENPAPLEKIGFDLSLLDLADKKASELTQLRSSLNGKLYQSSEAIIKRGQIYTLARRDVEEVRRFGKFVFRNDPEHAKLYSSHYERLRKAAYRRKQKDTEE